MQQRQYSLEEEITQETGGKRRRLLYVRAYVCRCNVVMYLCMSLCVRVRERERELFKKDETVMCGCVRKQRRVRQSLAPPPSDVSVPDVEVEKEEDESCSGAPTPAEAPNAAEESSVMVALSLIPPADVSLPRASIYLISPLSRPCLTVSRYPSALKFTPSTPM